MIGIESNYIQKITHTHTLCEARKALEANDR
jgi:hypothetical protein